MQPLNLLMKSIGFCAIAIIGLVGCNQPGNTQATPATEASPSNLEALRPSPSTPAKTAPSPIRDDDDRTETEDD